MSMSLSSAMTLSLSSRASSGVVVSKTVDRTTTTVDATTRTVDRA